MEYLDEEAYTFDQYFHLEFYRIYRPLHTKIEFLKYILNYLTKIKIVKIEQ